MILSFFISDLLDSSICDMLLSIINDLGAALMDGKVSFFGFQRNLRFYEFRAPEVFSI
jgi:hypothetical protein